MGFSDVSCAFILFSPSVVRACVSKASLGTTTGAVRLKSHRWRSGGRGGRSGFTAPETRDISMCVTSGISTAQGKAPLKPDARLKQTRAAAYQRAPKSTGSGSHSACFAAHLAAVPSLSTHQAAGCRKFSRLSLGLAVTAGHTCLRVAVIDSRLQPLSVCEAWGLAPKAPTLPDAALVGPAWL